MCVCVCGQLPLTASLRHLIPALFVFLLISLSLPHFLSLRHHSTPAETQTLADITGTGTENSYISVTTTYNTCGQRVKTHMRLQYLYGGVFDRKRELKKQD